MNNIGLREAYERMIDEDQENQLETVSEKNITLRLSEGDCIKINELCGENEITISQLLECFISDLIDGTSSNGSDERMLAMEYFQRCGYGYMCENTLLSWLLRFGFEEVDDFLYLIENIEEGYELIENNDDYDDEEIVEIREDIENWEKKLEEIKEDYYERIKKNVDEVIWDEEVEAVKKWYSDLERMVNE